MEAKAIKKYIRISPLKLRRITNTLKGEYVGDALNILTLQSNKASGHIKNALKSAIANAFAKKMKEEDMFISEIVVEKGPYFKRIKAKSRGRAALLLKPTSHLRITVKDKK